MTYLQTFGPRADPVTALTWGLIGLSMLVTVIIGAAVLIGVLMRRRRNVIDTAATPINRTGDGLMWIYIGLPLTIIALIGCLFWTMQVLAAVNSPATPPSVTVEITDHQWWWEVRYLDGAQTFATANEIHIPVGKPVLVKLLGADVIHSFWVPALTGKTDTIPGRTNIAWLQADKPGLYLGQCTEYCGVQHAHMAIRVTADSAADFEAWRRNQIKPAAQIIPEIDRPGQALVAAHCGACHTIRGQDIGGGAGPELTHLMSRQTLGAGVIPNNHAALLGWISNPEALKPGVQMPATYLSGAQLAQAAAYLETLK